MSRVDEVGIAAPLSALVSTDGPSYALQGFRWERSIVPVYYNWDGGICAFASNDFSGSATAIPQDVLLSTLQSSITEINANLRGGLTLQLAGPATRAELCSLGTTKPIVVGFGTMAATGLALSYATHGIGTYSNYAAARVFLNSTTPFVCQSAPIYRDLQHTMTHELLHAIGVGHSAVPSAIMTATFVGCQTPAKMQPDDVLAINALYVPIATPVVVAATVPVATTAPAGPAGSIGAGNGWFISAVLFSPSSQALTVFAGGSFDQLETAARAVGATGVWMQDKSGEFRLLVVDGPGFLRDQSRSAFPHGLSARVAVTLMR